MRTQQEAVVGCGLQEAEMDLATPPPWLQCNLGGAAAGASGLAAEDYEAGGQQQQQLFLQLAVKVAPLEQVGPRSVRRWWVNALRASGCR